LDKPEKNFYEVLGIGPTSSTTDIKRAYRQLVKEQHPDPGHRHKSDDERQTATEDMLLLNLAYETLRDKKRRAEYDIRIGVRIVISPPFVFQPTKEDEQRQVFLAKIFHPSRTAIIRVIGMYKRQLAALSRDPFDDELIAEFETYLDQVEAALRKGSDAFAKNPVPTTLAPAVHLMRQCIAQAADALEETRRFCQNYDYSHLSMAGTLFRIASDLAKESLDLTKC
jgi:molecular chaperone DnaJ